jgi:hypothetical protein
MRLSWMVVVAAKASHQAVADHSHVLGSRHNTTHHPSIHRPHRKFCSCVLLFSLSLAFAMEDDARQLKPILPNSEHTQEYTYSYFIFLFFLVQIRVFMAAFCIALLPNKHAVHEHHLQFIYQ